MQVFALVFGQISGKIQAKEKAPDRSRGLFPFRGGSWDEDYFLFTPDRTERSGAKELNTQKLRCLRFSYLLQVFHITVAGLSLINGMSPAVCSLVDRDDGAFRDQGKDLTLQIRLSSQPERIFIRNDLVLLD